VETGLQNAAALHDWVLYAKRIWSTKMVRVRMWVQGLGRGRAAVQCAAVQSDYAVKACVGAAKLSVAGVQ